MDIPKKFKQVPELGNKALPDFYRLVNYQKYHYDSNGAVYYNPLFSLDFDIDYNALPQIQVVGEKRWDTLFNDLYGQTYGWQILAYLNNVLDPYSEKPASGSYIYYIDSATMTGIINSLKGGVMAVKKFLTPFGIVEIDFLATLRHVESGIETNLISDFITQMKIGYNIFNYSNEGYIEYADKGSHLFGNDIVPLREVFEIRLKIDSLKIDETYISNEIKYQKMDTGSSDSILKINFVNKTGKRIQEIKTVKTSINKNLPVGDFLKNIIQDHYLPTGIWKPGVTAFSNTQFINSSLVDVIEDVKMIDRKRDMGSLFTLFCDFQGKLHYVEISDLIKTVQSSASNRKIFYSSFGHEYGLGFFTAPNVIQSFEYGSVKVDDLVSLGTGMKIFSFNMDTKVITPVPNEAGLKPQEIYSSIPSTNGGNDSISPALLSNDNVTEYALNYVTDGDEEEFQKIATNIATRSTAFLKYFSNNNVTIRLGFVNPDIEIVNPDGSIKNGVMIERVKEEPKHNGIEGMWMIVGIKHVLTGTQFYTDLELIRTGA